MDWNLEEQSIAADQVIDEWLGINKPSKIDNIVIHDEGAFLHFDNGKWEAFDNTFILIICAGCLPVLMGFDYDKIMKEYENWKV